jgi:hypothetical protein
VSSKPVGQIAFSKNKLKISVNFLELSKAHHLETVNAGTAAKMPPSLIFCETNFFFTTFVFGKERQTYRNHFILSQVELLYSSL